MFEAVADFAVNNTRNTGGKDSFEVTRTKQDIIQTKVKISVASRNFTISFN